MGAAAIPIAMMVAGAGSSLLSGAGAGSGKYNSQKIGDVSDVRNANPMTGNMFNSLRSLMGEYAPNNNIANLQGVTPGIQSIASSIISPYSASLTDTARILGEQNMRSVANQFSNVGAVNSGANLSAMSRGMAEPISQAITNIAGMQSQLGGGLANSILGQMGSAFYGGLQGATQYGAPEWWQPQYMTQYQPGILEILGGMLGGAAGSGGGLMGALGTGAK